MLKAFAIFGGGVLLVLAGVAAYAATRPDTFRVERALDIAAPPEAIYAILVDFRRSAEWSPFEKRDPDMKRSHGGAESGKGAVYEWDGDRNAGAGRMEIAEVSPPHAITVDFEMTRPMRVRNIVEYRLEPNGDATRVTWAMHGPVPYLAKVMHVFFDMDRMVGGDFEEGLANLKAVAERQDRNRPDGIPKRL